jgi:hypothetical protein
VIATDDNVAGTDATHSMAERAGATIIEAECSHVIMVSQPAAVAEAILTPQQRLIGPPRAAVV